LYLRTAHNVVLTDAGDIFTWGNGMSARARFERERERERETEREGGIKKSREYF